MTSTGAAVVATACVALLGVRAASFDQIRDSPAVQVSGTATIAGVVVSDSDPGQPVRRAVVSLSGAELPLSRAVITDAEGRFAFERLPPGRFSLKTSKGGYLPTTLGARRPGQRGTVLVVADGERLIDVTVRMRPGAVITGTITNPAGEPLEGLQVTALSVHEPEQQRFSMTEAGIVTDDRGVYRLFGLAPGDYFVVASPARRFSATGAGAAVVRSSAEVDAIFRELREMTRSDTPAPPPSRPSSDVASATAEVPPTFGYAPIFFPGTATSADARNVTVASGQERAGVDFVVERIRTAAIDGVVTNARGPLPPLVLSITPTGPRLRGVYGGSPVLSRPMDGEGRFGYTGVAPGLYTISARSTAAFSSGGGRAVTAGTEAPRLPGGAILWAAAEVSVDGVNTAVSLELQPAMRVAGQVRFEGTSQPPVPSGIRVSLTREGSTGSAMLNSTMIGHPTVPSAIVRSDGSFELTGILPGTYRISATTSGPAGWWLRSAMVDGSDALDLPLVFGNREVTSTVLTFTDRESEVFRATSDTGRHARVRCHDRRVSGEPGAVAARRPPRTDRDGVKRRSLQHPGPAGRRVSPRRTA